MSNEKKGSKIKWGVLAISILTLIRVISKLSLIDSDLLEFISTYMTKTLDIASLILVIIAGTILLKISSLSKKWGILIICTNFLKIFFQLTYRFMIASFSLYSPQWITYNSILRINNLVFAITLVLLFLDLKNNWLSITNDFRDKLEEKYNY